MKRKILIATTNRGKMAELSAMLDADVCWLSLSDFPDIDHVTEDGSTFAENARKKALGYSKVAGLWTIADDSGLVVDVLGGAPGVESARFSCATSCDKSTALDRKIIDSRNITKVLKLLESTPPQERTARFICCLCLAGPDEILAQTQGQLEGLIAAEPKGENGFGYDPIFFVPSLTKTVAQLTAAEKNAISHRGKAIAELKPLLDELLKS